jgi:hypothetical protein
VHTSLPPHILPKYEHARVNFQFRFHGAAYGIDKVDAETVGLGEAAINLDQDTIRALTTLQGSNDF